MGETPAFHAFGLAHCVVILLTAVLSFGLSFGYRCWPGSRFDRAVRIGIGSALVVNYLCYAGYLWIHGILEWEHALPLQLCDWTMIAVVVALAIGARSGWLEVAYFWGVGGSLQAILTPNLPVAFPDIRFLSFFLEHCGIVIGIAYLMITRRFRPTFGSVGRTLFWSETYLVVALTIDFLTGANYGFLIRKPEAASLLSLLSDRWSLYILQMNGLALIFFAVLYAPFALFDLMKPRPSVA